MDECFDYFLQQFGPAVDKQHVPASSLEHYRGKLPDQLLAYWEAYGWAGYGDGLFWVVNPQEYEPVLEAWIGDTPFMEQDAYHLIARTALGDLFFWGERSGRGMSIQAPFSFVVPRSNPKGNNRPTAELDREMQSFFASKQATSLDLKGDKGALFGQARRKLGQLNSRQMYGFVPALALGGPSTVEHLQVVDAVEHLVFLAQLQPLRSVDGSTIGQFM